MKRFDWWDLWLMGALLFCIGICVGLLMGQNHELHRMMDRAVAEGHARFYLDEKNVRCWGWLPACRK